MVKRSLKTLTVVATCFLAVVPGFNARGQSDDGRTRPSTFDVMFLAADAPLWIRIRLDGARDGIQSVRERYARLMISVVDADGDGFADADEAPLLPAEGRFHENASLLGENWQMHDRIDGDGLLSPEEYLAAVESHIGPIFSTRHKPPLLAQSVQLLPRLDLDGDHRISSEEIAGGPQTLVAFDFDDDGAFSPAELQPFPQSMVDAAMSEQLGTESQPFLHVDTSADRQEFVSRLVKKYGTEQGIPQERSGLSEFVFRENDSDGNGVLDRAEAMVLLQPRPLAEISVNLPAGKVELTRMQRGSDRVEELPVENPRRLAMRLGTETVEFSAHDNRYAASDQINLLRIRFLQADSDRNGYLEPQEFASLAGLNATFDEIDTDHDGKVFVNELDRQIRFDSYLAQCAVELEVEPIEKPLFSILDVNVDRRLTPREFATGIGRLVEFDQNADHVLDSDELHRLRRYRVKFAFVLPPAVRPDRNTLMMANRRMPRVDRSAGSGPMWFQKMDRNQDGDVTWREFLGPRTAFEQLDTDENGWIDVSEAATGMKNSLQ